jgi:hypothetical protein
MQKVEVQIDGLKKELLLIHHSALCLLHYL